MFLLASCSKYNHILSSKVLSGFPAPSRGSDSNVILKGRQKRQKNPHGCCKVLGWAANQHHLCSCGVFHIPLDQSWWMQLPIFLYSSMQQTTVRNSHNEISAWSCSLSFLFAFHFPTVCILSVMFNAFLSSINTIKLHILCLISCTLWEVSLWCVLWWGCPNTGGGTSSAASFSSLPLRRDSSPYWNQFCPKTCQHWFTRAVRPRSRQGGEAEQSYAACAPLKPPSFQPAQGTVGAPSALTQAHRTLLQHSHLHLPWESAGARVQDLL